MLSPEKSVSKPAVCKAAAMSPVSGSESEKAHSACSRLLRCFLLNGFPFGPFVSQAASCRRIDRLDVPARARAEGGPPVAQGPRRGFVSRAAFRDDEQVQAVGQLHLPIVISP